MADYKVTHGSNPQICACWESVCRSKKKEKSTVVDSSDTSIKNNPVIIAQLASISSFYDALKKRNLWMLFFFFLRTPRLPQVSNTVQFLKQSNVNYTQKHTNRSQMKVNPRAVRRATRCPGVLSLTSCLA